MPQNKRAPQAGFSLLEYVLGLTVLAIVLVGVGIYLLSYPRQLDSIFQFRAVALAEAVAEQVISVKYDHANNPYLADKQRCGAADFPCSNMPNENLEKVSDFSAVDDFQLWCADGERKAIGPIKGDKLAQMLDLPQPNLYHDFTLETCVELPLGSEEDGDELVKKVTITVNIGSRDQLSFKLDRYNIQ